MSRTLADAQDFVEKITQTDTNLGGYLQMTPWAKKSLAYLFLQFADHAEYLRELGILSSERKAPAKARAKEE